MRIFTEHFPSIHQLLKIINERPNNAVMRGCFSSHKQSEEFTLTKSWDHAIYLFRHGYTDILEQVKAGVNKNAKLQKAPTRRKIKTSVQGVVPHIPNAILGLPNSMIHFESTPQKTKAISLVYSIRGHARVDAQKFVTSGIAVLSTIHTLELRGFRVNLKIMFYNAKSGYEHAIGTVTLTLPMHECRGFYFIILDSLKTNETKNICWCIVLNFDGSHDRKNRFYDATSLQNNFKNRNMFSFRHSASICCLCISKGEHADTPLLLYSYYMKKRKEYASVFLFF